MGLPLEQALPRAVARPSLNGAPAAIAGCASILIAAWLAAAVSWRQAALFVVGIGAGLALYHAAFGFTSSWRVFISDRRGAGLRAQMLMLAVTCAVFFPLLASGQIFGQPLRGFVAPAGVGVVAGAFLFGIGMQLGGGCASGTLFTAGGGNLRMVITLLFFIAGSVIGLRHAAWWESLPAVAPVSFLSVFGAAGALVANFVLFGLIAWATVVMERRRHGQVTPPAGSPRAAWHRIAQGPWPLAAGALALAAVNTATLLLAGRPWGVTSAFALWGSKALAAVGVDVASWPYWAAPARAADLQRSLALDITSVMNAGILIGALAAASMAGRFAPSWRIPARSLIAAILGGLLLGYGARIAYGCNIGAFFSGIASGSLHGWLWLVAAFAGNAAGTRLRPAFGLVVEGRC